MAVSRAEDVYRQHIQPLSASERLQLLALLAEDAAHTAAESTRPEHSIMELHGLGAEIWRGVDAQQYVDELRNE
jgi:hypothetical protein